PGKFRIGHVVSLAAWAKLMSHGPFLVVVAAALLGAIAYTRLFGFHVVVSLLRTVFWRKKLDE
ncbi:MAG: hypothetical protein K0S65_4386, partial [Labilithrix sp.]|nr:hypothetical protein [Labilithrix sp.]